MFHGSYHFVQELYFTRYLFCAFCICRFCRDDVHIVSTEAAQKGIGI